LFFFAVNLGQSQDFQDRMLAVMVGVLTLNVVDHGYNPRSDQNYKIDIYFFFANINIHIIKE